MKNKNTLKIKKVTTIIKDKDQKILWARAAGLCSMPECRVGLTLKKEDTSSITLGEMCHIVGEKNSKKSPRGISKLPISDRSSYSNLILLCQYHHGIIDKNEKAWPVEKLHKIKDDHELWVIESLSDKKIAPDDLIYSSTIDYLTDVLNLDHWSWFMDNAVRHIIHQDFVDSCTSIIAKKLSILWPKTKPILKKAIINLMESYIEFITQYLEVATSYFHDEFLKPDKSYKRNFPNPNFEYYANREDLWANLNFLLLCKYTVRVNEFAEAVRKYSNPYYYCERGKFIIIDSMGTHLGDGISVLDPTMKNISKNLNLAIKNYDRFKKTHRQKLIKNISIK